MDTQVTPSVQKILVVTDHFSHHIQAYKVPDKRAITIAKCLYDEYFHHYGFPRRLMSDQGKEFCNDILKEMCYYLNIKKIANNTLSPSIQWRCGKSTSGVAPNDRETGQQKAQEVARPSRYNHSRLQFDEVTSHRLFALLFNDGTQAPPAC